MSRRMRNGSYRAARARAAAADPLGAPVAEMSTGYVRALGLAQQVTQTRGVRMITMSEPTGAEVYRWHEADRDDLDDVRAVAAKHVPAGRP